MICFHVNPEDVPPIYVNGKSISIVNNVIHLGNYISSDVHDRKMCVIYIKEAIVYCPISMFVTVKH